MTDDKADRLAVLAQDVVKKTRAPQIRPRLQAAITAMVTEGLTQAEAAKRAQMSAHSLQVALRKPHVRAFMSHVKDAWLNSRTSQAWLNVAELADRACSEDVRLKANRIFLEAAGELGGGADKGPVQPRQLVQIILNAAGQAGQLIPNQSSGVLEAVPYQALDHDASNSCAVGHGDSGDDDD